MSRDVRTSQGTFMSRHDDPQGVISWIEEKAAQVTGLPVSHGEVRWLMLMPFRVSSRDAADLADAGHVNHSCTG